MDNNRATSFSTLISLSITFSAGVGIIYLLSFWSAFGINCFEYAGLKELIAVSILPCLTTALIIIAGPILGEFVLFPALEPKLKTIKENRLTQRPATQWIRKFWTVFFYISLAVYIYVVPYPQNLALISMIVGLTIYNVLARMEFLKKLIPNSSLHRTVLLLICTLPVLSFTNGKLNADLIYKNRAYKYVEAKNFPHDIAVNFPEQSKYIGKLGEYNFFVSMDNKTVTILTDSHIPALTYKELKYNDAK